MKRLTLLSDGPTDQALLPILRWLLAQRSTAPFEQNWADLQRWRTRPLKLVDKVEAALPLHLPALNSVESSPDPKEILREALKEASNLSGRRRKQFKMDIRRLADLIDDFEPLRAVPSFRAFEASLCVALDALGLLRPDGTSEEPSARAPRRRAARR